MYQMATEIPTGDGLTYDFILKYGCYHWSNIGFHLLHSLCACVCMFVGGGLNFSGNFYDGGGGGGERW